MWVNKTRLPHALAPSAYWSSKHYGRELAQIFTPGWHFVASDGELLGHGDFITRDLFGTPVLVRNERGQLKAFVNACERRRSPLTRAERGTMPALRCPCHGGEYDGEGVAREGRLTPCRIARLGALVFVSLAGEGAGLREALGEQSFALAERVFSSPYRQAVARRFEHPCNWKVPLENVLESYHVPCLHDNVIARHPRAFKVFTGRRDGGENVHELGEGFTAYHDSLGADSATYRALVARLRPGARCDYVHHHAFPNLVFAHTSIVSFLQVVVPISPTRSRSEVRVFLDGGGDGDAPGRGRRIAAALGRAVAPVLRAASGVLIDLVLREDAAVYADVQRGLEASPHPGVLGAREERVHAFQDYVARACGLAAG